MAAIAAMLAAHGGANADTSSAFMPIGPSVAPPRGYLEFCARNSVECPEYRYLGGAPPAPVVQVSQRSEYWRLLFASIQPSSITPRAENAIDGWPVFGSGSDQMPQHRHTIQVSQDTLKMLGDVNTSVNQAIRPRSDMEVHGVADYWDEPLEDGLRYGDCEDYVLEKRRQLIELGVPVEDLSIALVRTAWREDHAVLLVNTDQGELVLDSLSPHVLPWRKVSYRWLSRQSPVDPVDWVAGPAHL